MCTSPGGKLRLRGRKGIGLLDVVLATFLLGVCGLVLTASFASAYTVLRQSDGYNMATRVCREEMEAVRGLGYSRLNPASLAAAGVVDPDQVGSPYSIAQAKNLGSSLPEGEGDLTISDESTGLKRVVVVVRWRAADGCLRAVTVTSLVADTTPLTR